MIEVKLKIQIEEGKETLCLPFFIPTIRLHSRKAVRREMGIQHRFFSDLFAHGEIGLLYVVTNEVVIEKT